MEQTERWRKKQPIQAAAACLVLLLFCGSSIWGDALSPGLHGEIEYARVNGQPLWLDAFVPDSEGPHPVVILVHGGGWVGGDKQELHFLAEPLTAAGFTCFSVGYRLAPQHRWPACLDDVQTAMRWVKAHAADYQGNPDQIALLGYSAGGHLACMAAVQEPVDAVVALAAPTDHLADSTRRGGLSECMQKLLDRPKAIDAQSKAVLEAISPINHVRTGLPAYLLIHGTADQSVPYEQSTAFQAELKAHHVPCRFVTLEGATHRISEWTTYNVDYQQQMIDWLISTVGGRREKASVSETGAKMTVSPDGAADFETVQAAVDAVPEWNPSPVLIAIAPGTYKERIVVPRSKRFVTFRGNDAASTILTYALSARMTDENGTELGTFRTPSVTIEADDFTAENITFENSAGDAGQAVALMAAGDRAVFRNCRFLGWQDTLLDQAGRHYYEKCHIAGHCDFIFGGGTAFFETCRIHCLDGSYITAASTPQHQPYGYVFSNCTITGEPEGSKTYLGRPWRDYAHVVFLNTEMSYIIRPAGWHNWSKPHREKTAFYGEYNSTGPGANPQQRVAWAHQLTADQAEKYTLEQVLAGDDGWNPMTQTVQTAVTITPAGPAQIAALKDAAEQQTRDGSAFLFTASSDKHDGVTFFLSRDGLTWNRLTGPLLRPVDSEQDAVIDPCLSCGPDGTFHLVWQNGRDNPLTIGYTRSEDLVHWKPRRFFEPMKGKDALHVLAPTVFYDPTDAVFIMMWASTLGGNYYQAYQEPVEQNPRLWYSTTKDFEMFTEAKPFFEPGYAVGKAAVVRHEGRYVLVHEDSRLAFGTLRTAFGNSPTGPWRHITNALPLKKGINPAVLKLGETYIVYFDSDASTRGALMTQDFLQWSDVSADVSFPRGGTYGRVTKVDAAVVEQLMRSQSLSEIR